MTELFDRDYFYGRKKSNYINYSKMNSSRYFKSIVTFIKNQKLKGSFLDIGCAFGYLLREVSLFFDELHGCDISRFAIQKAKKIIPRANLKIVDLNKSLPYPNESFDCVTALDVLEHTSNFEKNIGKIVLRLKRGGYFIISMPINAWPRKLFGFTDIDKTHISILEEKKLIQIVKKNRLQIVSKKHFIIAPCDFKIPFIPAAIELILRKR